MIGDLILDFVIYGIAAVSAALLARAVVYIIQEWPSLLPPPRDPNPPYSRRVSALVVLVLILAGWPIIAIEWAIR